MHFVDGFFLLYHCFSFQDLKLSQMHRDYILLFSLTKHKLLPYPTFLDAQCQKQWASLGLIFSGETEKDLK